MPVLLTFISHVCGVKHNSADNASQQHTAKLLKSGAEVQKVATERGFKSAIPHYKD
jgi:hypothetical protein